MTSAANQSIHVTGLFTELLAVGGVQEAGRLTVLALEEIAQRRGWSADFAALNDPAGLQTLRYDEREAPFHGFARAKLSFALSAARSARAAAGARSHIILAGHPNLAPIAVWMQKMSPRARAVVVAHGVEVWQPLSMFRRATIRHAFLVVAPSSDTLQKLVKIQRVAADRTRKLPWPVSPAFLRFTESPGAELPALAPPPGLPDAEFILTVGRAAASERYKGADSLIQAVAQLSSEFPDVHLVSVGGGDDLPRLEKVANDLGIAARVHFLRDLRRPQVAACYARAQIFALPSAGEGFGLVFLEAMAFGRPVIAASAGGALDLVRDEINGLLVAPQDVAGLAASLRRLLADRPLRERLGRHGAAFVRQSHQFAAFRDELESILDECVMDSRLRA